MVQESVNYGGRPGASDWKGTDRYNVVGCIGRGGMGVVYEAFDRERRQLVALKTLLHFDPSALYLFKQEFRTLADVSHANLVRLHELVVDDARRVFFTMELVRGTDFIRYVQRPDAAPAPGQRASSLLPPVVDRATVRPAGPAFVRQEPSALHGTPADVDRLRSALRQLVGAVNALHVAGKMHRDIKPSNVLVNADGRAVVLDFGGATMLKAVSGSSSQMVGTATYMAPEQADDAPPTPAADWYSVGVMLYEALVGQPPFRGAIADVLTMKHSVDPAPPAARVTGVPADLDALCRALLHRDPSMRPSGPEILMRLGETPSSVPPPSCGHGQTEPQAAVVGREPQLRALRQAFEDTRRGASFTVRVGGESGMGKSTTVHRFLDDLAATGEALVLRGRAYERETVPYKAVDAVIDALSRHLVQLPEHDAPPAPADAGLLVSLFPVLGQVPFLRVRGERPIDDPHALRNRAFDALRDLLSSLVERSPVVIFIDDAQWGDVDSAALLLELLRPPKPPSLLLILTHRAVDGRPGPFLAELRDRWPEGADASHVEVGPLDVEDGYRLAMQLLGGTDEIARRTARAVARESRGSPFLIDELVRSNRGVFSATGATLAILTLDQMVDERLERMPEDARRFVEVVAVGARPLPMPIAMRAAGLDAGRADAILPVACARRFTRTGQRGGEDVVESVHDRIRETLIARLAGDSLRDHHVKLAHALEEAPGADAEAVAAHWLAAGETQRAARLAQEAAEQAAGKLAFDRAARLFRLALDNAPESSGAAVQRLRVRLAETLQLAGRHAESADMYLAATEGAAPDQRVELQRAAAEQLLTTGRIDEGTEVLRRVLEAVGMRAPRSPLAAVFWLLVFRIWLVFRGLGGREREPDEVSREDRVRVDTLFTVSIGFSNVNVILGACMQARHLIEALRVGDRFQLLRAIALEAAHMAAGGAPIGKRERDLFATARRMAARSGSEEAVGFTHGCLGIGLFLRGRWLEARAMLDRRDAMTHSRSGLAHARLFAAHTYYFTGEFAENRRRMGRLLDDAQDRGDVYTIVNLRTSTEIRPMLVRDDPDGAWRVVREGLAQWTDKGLLVQHWQALVYGADIDLYAGKAADAHERLEQTMPALRKSFNLASGFSRAITSFVRGRAAIGSIAANPEQAAARISHARRMAADLGKEPNPWTGILAALVTAATENAAGNRNAAAAALEVAIAR